MRSVLMLYSKAIFIMCIVFTLFAGNFQIQANDALPEPLPGNPEYIIRVIYFVPSDRLLDFWNHPDCPQYKQKIDDAVARIRSLLETLDDFVNWQITSVFSIPSPPGVRLNFERVSNGMGAIKIHIIHGKRMSEGKDGYWRDAEGLNAIGALGPIIEELFGWDRINEVTKKTAYIFIPDIGVWDDSLPGIRGYVGGGQGMLANTSGWGGYCCLSGGVLPFIPPDSGRPGERKKMWHDYLSSDTSTIQVPNPYSGDVETWDLNRIKEKTLARCLSTFAGVMGHELMHAFGLGHKVTLNKKQYINIMSRGYMRFGHAVSAMYGFGHECYPYDPPGSRHHDEICSLDKAFAYYLAYCPYLSKLAHQDKRDPETSFSWPPFAHVWRDISEYYLEVRAREEIDGSGLNAAYLYFKGNLWEFQKFNPESITNRPAIENNDNYQKIRFQNFPDAHKNEFKPGSNLFSLSVTDRAGNLSYNILKTFVMDSSTKVVNNMFFVSPPHGLRNKHAELGSSANPYDSIQKAIDAAHNAGRSTVIVREGIYPLTEPILPKNDVSLVGERVGSVILDGLGHGDMPIILAADHRNSSFSGWLHSDQTVLANLVFANAGWGIKKKDDSTFYVYNFAITNCAFYNMAHSAIDIEQCSLNVLIMQNSIVDCTSGIVVRNYKSSVDPHCRFDFRNNLVVNRSNKGTTGILLEKIPGLGEMWRGGWNNSWGFAKNFAGTDSYADNRLPGEISQNIEFVLFSTYDFRPKPGTSCIGKGDPLTANAYGERRNIGAF